jgi:hypothetical protein
MKQSRQSSQHGLEFIKTLQTRVRNTSGSPTEPRLPNLAGPAGGIVHGENGMPSAWEGTSLTHNLGVLAMLAMRPVGTKLKFNSSSGKFDIDERSSISRTFSWDSVTSESHFAIPMGGLLRTAQAQIGTASVSQRAFDDALAGLAKLRRTYEGSEDKELTERMKTTVYSKSRRQISEQASAIQPRWTSGRRSQRTRRRPY